MAISSETQETQQPIKKPLAKAVSLAAEFVLCVKQTAGQSTDRERERDRAVRFKKENLKSGGALLKSA